MAVLYMEMAVVIGIFLFWLRCRSVVLFGFIELIFSLVIIHLTAHPGYGLLAGSQANYPEVLVSRWAGFLAAIYVFVRGLDNIDKGPPPLWLRPTWRKIFYSRQAAKDPRAAKTQP